MNVALFKLKKWCSQAKMSKKQFKDYIKCKNNFTCYLTCKNSSDKNVLFRLGMNKNLVSKIWGYCFIASYVFGPTAGLAAYLLLPTGEGVFLCAILGFCVPLAIGMYLTKDLLDY